MAKVTKQRAIRHVLDEGLTEPADVIQAVKQKFSLDVHEIDVADELKRRTTADHVGLMQVLDNPTVRSLLTALTLMLAGTLFFVLGAAPFVPVRALRLYSNVFAALFSLFTAVVLFVVCRKQVVQVKQDIKEKKWDQVGLKLLVPFVAWIGGTSIVYQSPVFQNTRTVNAYLISSDNVATFNIRYETPDGPRPSPGEDNYALLNAIPVDAKSVKVLSFSSPTHKTENEAKGILPPWEYTIKYENETAKIEVPVVSAKSEPVKLSDLHKRVSTDITPFLKLAFAGQNSDGIRDALTSMPMLAAAEYRIDFKNDTGEAIRILGFDCARLHQTLPPHELGSVSWIDVSLTSSKGIQKSSQKFDEFYEPSGWFLFYVEKYNSDSDKMEVHPVKLVNLFKSRNPVVSVVPADSEHGVDLEVNHN